MSINRIFSSHFSSFIWIFDFEIIYHCSNNKSLFSKQLKKVNDIVNTTSDETFNVEDLNNITILFSSKKTLTFIDVMYIFDLIVNLMNTSKLYFRKWIITYFVDKFIKLHKDDDLINQIDLINDLFVLRIVQNLINTIFIISKIVTSIVHVSKAFIFAFSKSIIDLKIWHKRLIHSKYRNVIANFNKIIDMKEVKDFVSNMFCELCMFDRQQIEIFKISTWKFTMFELKISVDIDDLLSLTIRSNRFFIFIKCYEIVMMFWFVRKHKSKIYKIVIDWIIWIERQTNCKIKIIVTNDEFVFIVFDNWFKEIDIQWKFSAFYTFEQNDVIERTMYTIMFFVRSIFKNIRLSKNLWNLIDEIVVHVKNRILITSDDNDKVITSFEIVNHEKFNVFNLRALNYKTYTHIFKIINRHKFDDRSWKSIFVNYVDNNQWKIYNSRTKKVHIIRNVRFDENYFYYDQNHNTFSNFDEYDNEFELSEFWHSKDDNWFDFRSEKSLNSSEKISFSKKTSSKEVDFVQTSFTSKSLSSRDTNTDDDAENAKNAKFEEKKFIEISKDHISDSTSTNELQVSSFSDNFIFEISTSSFKVSQQNENFVFEIQKDMNENELTFDSFNSSTSFAFNSRKRSKTFSLFSFDRSTRSKDINIARFDYFKTNNLNIKRIKNIKKSKKFVNVVNNVYQIKQVFKIHIHIFRILHALQHDENFDFDHISKLMNYKKTLRSFYWLKWKIVMKLNIVSHIKNDI